MKCMIRTLSLAFKPVRVRRQAVTETQAVCGLPQQVVQQQRENRVHTMTWRSRCTGMVSTIHIPLSEEMRVDLCNQLMSPIA